MGKKKKKKAPIQASERGAPNPSIGASAKAEPPDPPNLDHLMNSAVLEGLRSEGDAILLSLMATFNPVKFWEFFEHCLCQDQTRQSREFIYDGISMKWQLIPSKIYREASDFLPVPYQVASIQIDSTFLQMHPDQISQQVLSAMQKSYTHCFLDWLSYVLLLGMHWTEHWDKISHEHIEQSGRSMLDPEMKAAIDDLGQAYPIRVKKIVEGHIKIINQNYDEAWKTGFIRYIRKHPSLATREGERILQKIIRLTESLNSP